MKRNLPFAHKHRWIQIVIATVLSTSFFACNSDLKKGIGSEVFTYPANPSLVSSQTEIKSDASNGYDHSPEFLKLAQCGMSDDHDNNADEANIPR